MNQRSDSAPRWLLVLASLIALGLGLYALRAVLTPVFFGFIIAYMLDPLVDRLEEKGLGRGMAIAVLLTGFLSALGAFIVIIIPTVAHEIAAFTAVLPEKVAGVIEAVQPRLSEMGIDLDEVFANFRAESDGGFQAWVSQLQGDAREVAGSAAGPLAKALSFLLGGAVSVVGAIFGLLMVPVLAAYLLYDFDRIVAAVGDLIPRDHEEAVSGLFRDIDEMMSQFIRGQITVMLVLGILYAIGFSVAGVRLAVLIGIIAGMLSFIPYVGGGLALVLALLMWLLDGAVVNQLIAVLGVYGLVQLLDGFLITPRIVGEKVGLSSIWVLLALMVGGEVFGFMGVLMAVPAAAVLKVLVGRGVATYRESALYRGQAAEEGEASEPVVAESEIASDEEPSDEVEAAESRLHTVPDRPLVSEPVDPELDDFEYESEVTDQTVLERPAPAPDVANDDDESHSGVTVPGKPVNAVEHDPEPVPEPEEEEPAPVSDGQAPDESDAEEPSEKSE